MGFVVRSPCRGTLAAPACMVPHGLNPEAAVAGSACVDDGQALRAARTRAPARTIRFGTISMGKIRTG